MRPGLGTGWAWGRRRSVNVVDWEVDSLLPNLVEQDGRQVPLTGMRGCGWWVGGGAHRPVRLGQLPRCTLRGDTNVRAGGRCVTATTRAGQGRTGQHGTPGGGVTAACQGAGGCCPRSRAPLSH